MACADDGAGEVVALEGTLRFISHTTIDAAGGAHFTSRTQPVKVSGVGQTTGDKYRGVGNTSEYTNVNAGGLPFTGTVVNNFRIIGQAPGNNAQIHTTFHVTVNENGEVTAEVTNSSSTCG